MADRSPEDAAWEAAYNIAYVGASNPVGISRALATHSEAMLRVLHSTEAIKAHGALQAIAAHLAFLYGHGLGPAPTLLDEVVRQGKRLGLTS